MKSDASPTEATLDVAAAVPLAHALVDRISANEGIRALAIKGPVSAHHKLRGPRTSADADVLVEPQGFIRVCSMLERRGWHLRVGRETPSPLPNHSRTYIHDEWPCDIDVHWMFPGFFAEPDTVFDALWSARSTVELAHVPVSAPSRAGAAVIAALHAQRNARSGRNADELSRLMVVMSEDFDASERNEFYGIVRQGRATWVLREMITELGLGEAVGDATADEQWKWEITRRYIEDGSTAGWLVQLRATPWLHKPRFLGRALWVPRSDIPRNDPTMRPSRGQAWAYQRARWMRGARAIFRYARGEGERAPE